MNRFAGSILLLAWLAWPGPVAAQQQDAFVVHGIYSVNLSCPIYQMDHGGRVVQTLATVPTGYRPMDIVMDGDNRTIRVLAFDLNRSQIAVVDIAPGGAVTTAASWSGPMPSAMLRTDDGDWIVLSQLMAQRPVTYLYQLSGSSVSSLAAGWGILAYAATWDPDCGDIVVRGRGPDTYGTTLWGYYKIDRTSGALTTITAYPEKGEWPAAVGARHPPWRAVPGTFVDLVWDGKLLSSFLAHVHPERGALTRSAYFPGLQVSDMVYTNQRNLPVAYVGVVQDAPIPIARYLVHFTEDGLPASLRKIPGTPALVSGTRVMRIGGRHLAWFMNVPPNGRSLKLDFPGEGGRPYVVAFGLSGTRPGVPLVDGRTIPLNVDGLTHASVHGGLGSVLADTVGWLDATGSASVVVDTNALGGALQGLRVWAVALLLDTRRPAGFSHILGPTVLTIK